MTRRKSPRGTTTQRVRQPPSGVHRQWVWVALLTGLIFGGMVGYFLGQTGARGDGVALDRYGRGPANAHYRHNHP